MCSPHFGPTKKQPQVLKQINYFTPGNFKCTDNFFFKTFKYDSFVLNQKLVIYMGRYK